MCMLTRKTHAQRSAWHRVLFIMEFPMVSMSIGLSLYIYIFKKNLGLMRFFHPIAEMFTYVPKKNLRVCPLIACVSLILQDYAVKSSPSIVAFKDNYQ